MAHVLNSLSASDYHNKENCEQAIQLNSQEKRFYANKALVLIALQRYQEASDAANMALQIDANYEDAKILRTWTQHH